MDRTTYSGPQCDPNLVFFHSLCEHICSISSVICETPHRRCTLSEVFLIIVLFRLFKHAHEYVNPFHYSAAAMMMTNTQPYCLLSHKEKKKMASSLVICKAWGDVPFVLRATYEYIIKVIFHGFLILKIIYGVAQSIFTVCVCPLDSSFHFIHSHFSML